MYLVDTNVISELRQARSPQVDKNVLSLANGVAVSSLHWK